MEQPVASSARFVPLAIRRWIAIGGWLLVLIEQAASLVIWSRSGFAAPGYVFMLGPAPMLALHASLAAQAVAGLILTIRRPDNRVGWVIVIFAVVTAASTPVMTATAGLTTAAPANATVTWLAWAVGSVVFPAASFLAFLLAFIFPTGQLVSARWRTGLAAVAAAASVAACGIAIRPGPLLFFPTIGNPVGLDGGVDVPVLTAAVFTLLSASGIVAGCALWVRYRSSQGVIRVQIRWYIAAGVLLAIAYVAEAAGILALSPTDPRGEVVETFEFLVLGIPPIAITVAILRYRLYDIDTIISRAFVFGALTAVLAGIYTASIRLFNAIFVATTGENSDIALVITTLLLATTFTPIKRRIEALAEHRLGPATGSSGPVPSWGGPSLLDDPEFKAVLDARIRAALEARPQGSGRTTE